MKRAYSMSEWQADFARAFAPHVATQARGPLLAANNDEPEPDAIETRDWPLPPVKSLASINEEANEEARRIVADKALDAAKAADPFRQAEAARAQQQELARMPNGGYING